MAEERRSCWTRDIFPFLPAHPMGKRRRLPTVIHGTSIASATHLANSGNKTTTTY